MTGTGLAGAAAAVGAAPPAQAASPPAPRMATERAYRPLPSLAAAVARIQAADTRTTGLTFVEAALARHAIVEDEKLVVIVRAVVPPERRGSRRVLRTMLVGDNGDLRMETVGPEVRIDEPQFELETTLDGGHPIRDWNLIRERIFAVRVTLNILEAGDFAVSDDFIFKVCRR
jgi:hypothetical protein